MPKAWTCVAHPQHGAFLQTGIEDLQRRVPAFRRGMVAMSTERRPNVEKRIDRFACPRCCAEGLPGFVRPASSTEVARLAT